MNSPQLLKAYEPCNRAGIWSRDWERAKIDFHDLLQAGLKAGLTTDRQDYGEAAGEEIIGIASRREVVSDQHNVYDQCVHHAAISDIVSCAIRKPTDKPWTLPDPIELPNGEIWSSGAFLAPSGTSLRRVVLATSWNDDRHYAEARSWSSLGEVCVYGLPMQEAVIVLGPNRDGRRHGYWSRGLRHPVNKKLRFRKKTDKETGFKSSWTTIFREDYDEISTKEWLEAMFEDGVLQDVCFSVEVPVPEEKARQRIVDLAAKKLDLIYSTKILPDQQLSTCDFPYPCSFRVPCHSGNNPSGKYGFVPVGQIG
jgi:hypothetical protein